MIRRTLSRTKAATFPIHFPSAGTGFPTPLGTGFFVTPEGHFLTAAHVVSDQSGVRPDVSQAVLIKEDRFENGAYASGDIIQKPRLILLEPEIDLAVLKFDAIDNTSAGSIRDSGIFPSLQICGRVLEEGEPVYSFGYPLSRGNMLMSGPELFVGEMKHSPRVTSAIVSSLIEYSGMLMEHGPPQHYVLDKALNYGNSGGPIVSADSGFAHALCTRFQPVQVPQRHLPDRTGRPMVVTIPSLYGIVQNLSHSLARERLAQAGVPIYEG